jgi:hypothetical protein
VTRSGKILKPTLAILDSGADSTTFPLAWAARIGIDVERDCVPAPCDTAAGGTTGFYYPGDVEAIVMGEPLPLSATFNPGLGVVLLGRSDFFDWYKVLFDQRAKIFTIERHMETP